MTTARVLEACAQTLNGAGVVVDAVPKKPQGPPPGPPQVPPPQEPPKVGPSKEVVKLSEDLERLLKEDQLKAKVPAGMDKCPQCGTAIAPMRAAKVRTHDDALTGRRCDASQRPWSDFPGAKRMPAGKASAKAAAKAGKGGKPKASGKRQEQRRLRMRPRPKRSPAKAKTKSR
jgi:hypothetical protein